MNAFELTAAYPALPGTSYSYYSLDLLVLAGAGQVVAAQFNTEKNQLISLFEYSYSGDMEMEQHLPAQQKLLENEGLFHKPYRREILAVDYPVSTLIPADIFDKKNIREYLALLFDLPEGQAFLSDEVKSMGIINAYCLPEEWHQMIREKFPSGSIHHVVTPLLTGCNIESGAGRYPDGNAICCHLRQNMLDLVIHRSGKLLYFNSFHYNNQEEFVYYILFVFEQLSIDPQAQEVVLYGDVEKKPEWMAFVRTFLGNIYPGDPPLLGQEIQLSGDPDLRKYFNLLNLRLCV